MQKLAKIMQKCAKKLQKFAKICKNTTKLCKNMQNCENPKNLHSWKKFALTASPASPAFSISVKAGILIELPNILISKLCPNIPSILYLFIFHLLMYLLSYCSFCCGLMCRDISP